MTINARQMVEEVTRYLRDDDPEFANVHWSEQDLLDYFRLAVEVVASVQKDRFISRVSVPLVPGQIQTIPTACRDEPTVLGQLNQDGRVVSFPRQTTASRTAMYLSNRIGCKDCDGEVRADSYVMDSWSVDSGNPNVFYVEPPVPDGAKVSLDLTCFIPPTVSTLDDDVDLGAQVRPAVFHLMLHYAYGVDIESVPQRDRATSHWNQAFQLLGFDKNNQLPNRYTATRIPETRVRATK